MSVLGRKKQAKVPPNGAVFRGLMRKKPGAFEGRVSLRTESGDFFARPSMQNVTSFGTRVRATRCGGRS